MIQMPSYIKELVEAGIEITIKKDHNLDLVGFDLNPQTKSGMFLYQHPDTEEWRIAGRYNFDEAVEDLSDVMSIFLDFYRMRDFGNIQWLEFLVSKGMLEKEVETKVTYI